MWQMMCQKYQSEWRVYNIRSAFLSLKMIYNISAVFSGAGLLIMH